MKQVVWFLACAGALIGSPIHAYDTVMELDGLYAVVLNDSDDATATEARIVLVDSDFIGNDNPYKMTHTATIMFRQDTIQNRKCDQPTGEPPCWRQLNGVVTTVDNVTWESWSLTGTRVSIIGPDPKDPVLLADYKNVLDLGREHSRPRLRKVHGDIWEGVDPTGRVQSRVHIVGGSLQTKVVRSEVVADGKTTSEDLAYSVKWRGPASEVWLSPLPDQDRPLKIQLKQVATIHILNGPEGGGDKHMAHHIREFYFLTKVAPRTFPITAHVRTKSETGPDTFCPPVGLGRP
jgi:hypothetical protein